MKWPPPPLSYDFSREGIRKKYWVLFEKGEKGSTSHFSRTGRKLIDNNNGIWDILNKISQVERSSIMEHKNILELLRNEKRNLQDKFGLISIGLFGSHAKGTEGHESDVDLLVELSEARFDSLVGLQIYLEKRLGKPVELVRKRKGLNDRFLRRIERDIQYV